jgi:chromosome segregation ATPase
MSQRENRRLKPLIKIFLAAVALFLGCSSSELEKVQGELKSCGDRRSSLAREIESCRKESARLKERLNGLQTALAEPLPPSVKEAREEFLKSVPEEVRVELELHLDSYFTAVAREFKDLQNRNKEILLEMKQARREISQEISKTSGQVEEVASNTSDLKEGLASVQKGAEEAQQLRQRQQQTAAEIQKIVSSLVEFDRSRLNCRECKDKLKLMDKNREAILKFHSRLVQELTAIQTAAEGAAK